MKKVKQQAGRGVLLGKLLQGMLHPDDSEFSGCLGE